MAELNNSRGQAKSRNPKQAPRVDLTAMVDLAFLLITFFMLTTTLAKQNAMTLAMTLEGPSQPVSEARTIMICIGKDNMLQWYAGTLEEPLISPALTSAAGIRQILQEQSRRVHTDTRKDLMVLIKPSDKAKYHNLVDLLDEMTINRITRYAVADITQPELDMMQSQKIY